MKSLLKRILVPTLASPTLSKLGTWLFGHSPTIFMLHRIHSERQVDTGITPEYLRRCLQYLVDEGYNFLSLEEVIQAVTNQQALPSKSVVFTMDDGFWDQAEIATPIFFEFNCPATLFVITGMLDNLLWPWDDKVAYLIDNTCKDTLQITLAEEQYLLPLTNGTEKSIAKNTIRDSIKATAADSVDETLNELTSSLNVAIPQSPPDDFKPISWNSARKLEAKGIKFAPHTITHRILSKLDAASAESEIMGSWQRLKEELSSPSPIFCYPTGRYCDYGPREVALLKKAGFIGAVSTISAPIKTVNISPNYVFNLPRLSLPTDFNDFIQYCSWIETAKEKFKPKWV